MTPDELTRTLKRNEKLRNTAVNWVTAYLQQRLENSDPEAGSTNALSRFPQDTLLVHAQAAARSTRNLSNALSLVMGQSRITNHHIKALETVQEDLEEALADVTDALIKARRDMS